jgi:hypothetical protein
MSKGDKIRKEERRKKKEARNVSRAGRDRKIEDDCYFAKSRMPLQTKPKKSTPYTITKEDATRESTKDRDQEMCMFAVTIFESRYSEDDHQSTRPSPLHVKVEIIHYDEMNDKIFDINIDIDIDMNV